MTLDLSEAWQHQQSGRLDLAEACCEAILSFGPDNAEALHLLGIVSFQRGNPPRAAALIERAIAISPRALPFHTNLAEVYRALGRPDLSMGCCRRALELDPGNADARGNLGSALMALGDVESAVAELRESIRLRPDHAMAHNNLGHALRVRGDRTGALAHFRRAVALQPALVEGHSNLGQLLLEMDEPAEALSHSLEAVRLRPGFAEARNNLGNALRAVGRIDEARACYEEALRLNPNLPMTYNNLGQLHQEAGRFEDAIGWYRRAIQLAPRSARFALNLAGALAETGRTDEAEVHYQEALRHDPANAEAYLGLGLLRHDQGRLDGAQASFRTAIQVRPDLAAAHASLGGLLAELGDFEPALASFREALRHDPANTGALAQLAGLLRAKLPDAEEAAIRARLADPRFADAKRWPLLFGLAQVLDARGAFAEAAELLERANARRRDDFRRRGQGHDPDGHRAYVDRLIAAFTPEFFERVRGFGLETERPVFVVGLPRSGTSLVEQILASHSRVFGAGELHSLRQSFDVLPAVMGRTSSPADCLANLDRGAVAHSAERYLDRLCALDETADRVVDKMPDNFLMLGWIATLFPRARIVHCRRDARDVALSCWSTNFAQVNWTNHPDHIAGQVAQYRRIMEHWRRVLPVAALDVDYEAMVDDLESTARGLIAWCGLEWEPACLAFHETRRAVLTASSAQVRRPVYSSSVGRWRNYAPYLGRLFEQVA